MTNKPNHTKYFNKLVRSRSLVLAFFFIGAFIPLQAEAVDCHVPGDQATPQACVDAVCFGGGGNVFIAPGTYEGLILNFANLFCPDSDINIQGSGQNATILEVDSAHPPFGPPPRAVPAITLGIFGVPFIGGDYTVSDLTLRCTADPLSVCPEPGMGLSNGTSVHIHHVNVEDFSVGMNNISDNTLIEHTDVYGYVEHISPFTGGPVPGFGIGVSPASAGLSGYTNAVISNNKTVPAEKIGPLGQGTEGIVIGGVDGWEVSHNLVGSNDVGIFPFLASDGLIESNVLCDNNFGIALFGLDDVDIRVNILNGSTAGVNDIIDFGFNSNITYFNNRANPNSQCSFEAFDNSSPASAASSQGQPPIPIVGTY